MTLLLTIAALAISLIACGDRSRAASANVASPSTGRASATVDEPSLVVRDFELAPPEVRVVAGATINVMNEGPTIHNVAIRDQAGTAVETTRDLRTGESDGLEAAVTPGRYILYCSLPGHESLGIKGTLIVVAE